VPNPANYDSLQTTTCSVYVVLGTNHRIQCRWKGASASEAKLSDGLDAIVRELVGRHSITLIAEEAPHDVPTVARHVSADMRLPYLQVEMLPSEYERYGIRQEMDMLAAANSRGDADYRCPHADDIREHHWLDKVQSHPSANRVLLVCGYAHTAFLVDKVRGRGKTGLEVFFPRELGEREIVELANCGPGSSV
jgi:hypothetical protein